MNAKLARQVEEMKKQTIGVRGGAEADGCPADGDEPPEQRGDFLQQDKMRRLRELVRLQGVAFQR